MSQASEQIKTKHVIFCKCGGERIDSNLLQTVDESLKNLPVKVTRLSDLCGLAVRKREILRDLFVPGAEYLVIGCHRRVLNQLFDQILGKNGSGMIKNHINLIKSSPDQILEQLNTFCADPEGTSVYYEIREDSGWTAWYPVIDYSRCSACGQCADFCLFGVYEKTGNRVTVTNPADCKNNCPACARICPATAIIFPKYRNGGAISGSDEIDENAEQVRQAQDLEQFLGSDIYAALEKRKARRQSVIRAEAMQKALLERYKALNEISKN